MPRSVVSGPPARVRACACARARKGRRGSESSAAIGGRGRVTDGQGDTLVEDLSLGLLGGGGVEFFLNSNLAAGLTVQLQRHLMSAVRYTGLHAVAGVTWY